MQYMYVWFMETPSTYLKGRNQQYVYIRSYVTLQLLHRGKVHS